MISVPSGTQKAVPGMPDSPNGTSTVHCTNVSASGVSPWMVRLQISLPVIQAAQYRPPPLRVIQPAMASVANVATILRPSRIIKTRDLVIRCPPKFAIDAKRLSEMPFEKRSRRGRNIQHVIVGLNKSNDRALTIERYAIGLHAEGIRLKKETNGQSV